MNTTVATGETLYSTLGGDPDLGEIVELFVEEMGPRSQNLSNCFEQRDWEGLRRTAHQLKGAAGSYGFVPISVVAGQLEDAVFDRQPEKTVCQLVQRLVDLCGRASAGMPQ